MRHIRLKNILIVFTVLLLVVVLSLLWLGTTESGLRLVYKYALAYAPGEVSIEKIEGRLFGSMSLTGVRYQQNEQLVTAAHIDLQWQPLTVLMASVDISHLHVQSLNITLATSEQNDQALTLPDIYIPLHISVQDAVIDDLTITRPDDTFTIKQISLNASALFNKIDIESLNIIADHSELNVSGKIRPVRNYEHNLVVDWHTQLPSTEVLTGKGTIEGNVNALTVQQQLSGPLQLGLHADLNDVLNQSLWQATIDANDINLARIDTDWPAITGKLQLQAQGDINNATVSGTIDGYYPDQGPFAAAFNLERTPDNIVHIDQLSLHAPSHDTQLNARGTWTPGDSGGKVVLQLDWQNLRWPLRTTAWFDTASGNGSIEGSLDHYSINITTDRPWPQAPASIWQAHALGNTNGLDIQSLHIAALDGEVNANGRLNWSPHLSWQADIKASHIDPAKLWPQWPGKLNATISSTGSSKNGGLIADANITTLTGTLRNYPVSARSHLRWRNDTIDVQHFKFQSGDSTVSAHGQIGSTLQLDWNIDATSLAQLYPDSGGQLKAEGRVAGNQSSPLIEAVINGNALKMNDITIGSVTGNLAIDLFSWQQININMAAESLTYKNSALQTLHIDADTKQLQITAVSDSVNVDLILNGITDKYGWRGQIVKADISSDRFASWQLEAAATLTLSKDTLVIDRPCWYSNDSRLCLAVKHAQQNWHAELNSNQLPLLIFSPWLPPDLKLDGSVNANANVSFIAPDQLLGNADIEFLPGNVSYPLLEGEREHWQYRDGAIKIILDQQKITATTAIAMNNGDFFKAQLMLPEVKPLQLDSNKQAIQARAQLNIHDLGLIEALLPDVQDLSGTIDMNVSVSGTLAQPRLSGRAQLHDGAFRVPRMGLNIEQLRINSHSDGNEKLSYRLEAHSGDGQVVVQGQTVLNRGAGWPATITIKGDNFEVAHIPEARISVTPDLLVKTQLRTIDVTGAVHVPFAKLQPKDLTTATRVSDDVVITGDERTIDDKWTVGTRVRVSLGERVTLYGFGFEGRLGGSLLLEDSPGQLTRATGEINVVEGRYSAYGQRLDVEHGRLLYTGGPVSNPGLDLRAVRKVNNVTAGLKVRGSLNQPQVELFSIPAMGDTDALSYLLLGRPLETASGKEGDMMAKAALALSVSSGDTLARNLGDRFGLDEMRVESNDTGEQASLVVGRYLSPRLYVSYGVGLVEAFNTFNVRYQISDNWQLKGESGESQGADLFYIIER